MSELISSVEGDTERISVGRGKINRGKGQVRQTPEKPYGNDYVIPFFMNDVECAGFRDTGSDLLIIGEDLIADRSAYTGNVINVTDVFGRLRVKNGTRHSKKPRFRY